MPNETDILRQVFRIILLILIVCVVFCVVTLIGSTIEKDTGHIKWCSPNSKEYKDAESVIEKTGLMPKEKIDGIALVQNETLKERYEKRKKELKDVGTIEKWGCHGTSEFAILNICKDGFKNTNKLIQELKQDVNRNSKGDSEAKRKFEVKFHQKFSGNKLGNGTYLAIDYQKSMEYTKDSNKLLIVRYLPCKVLTDPKRYYEDNESLLFYGKDVEIVIPDQTRILPVYVVKVKY